MATQLTPPSPPPLHKSVPLVKGYEEATPLKPQQPHPTIPNVAVVLSPSMTDVKMEKIFYGIIAILAISIGYIALVIGSAPSLLLAIPTLVAGGMLIWKITRMRDYADPTELQNYRFQATRQRLDETAKEHGWDNMFQYGIPAQDDFNKLYDAHIQKCIFRDGTLIGAYETLKACRDNCMALGKTVQIDIPHPSIYQPRFLSEIEGKSTSDIFREYPVEQLVQYGLLSNDTLLLFKGYKNGQSNRDEQVKAAHDAFTKERQEHLDAYETALRQTQFESKKQGEWLLAELQNVENLRNPNNHTLLQCEISDEELGEGLKALKERGVELRVQLEASKKAHDASVKQIDDRLAEAIKAFNNVKLT